MGLPCCCDSRQVGDTEDLMIFANSLQFTGDCGGYSSADIGIDFIKDEYGDFIRITKDGFDGQHDAGDFAAAGDLSQGKHFLAHIGCKGEFDRIGAVS